MPADKSRRATGEGSPLGVGGDGGFSPFLPAQDRGVQRRLSFPADWIKAPSGCLRPRAGVGKREAEGEQANLIITSTGAREKKRGGGEKRGEERGAV